MSINHDAPMTDWDTHYINEPTIFDEIDDLEDARIAEVVSVIAWLITLCAAGVGIVSLTIAFPIQTAWLLAQF